MPLWLLIDADQALRPDGALRAGVERLDQFPGAEADVVLHAYDCPHYHDAAWTTCTLVHPDCLPGCHPRGPLYRAERYTGCVLATRERNYADDSDFYAVVWDAEAAQLRTVEYGTTRAWSYANVAKVDATPAVRAAAAACNEARIRRALWAAADADARRPAPGKVVGVLGGTRATPAGTQGLVFWRREDRRGQTRLGLHGPEGKTYWVDADKVEVVNPADYLPAGETIDRQARAAREDWTFEAPTRPGPVRW